MATPKEKAFRMIFPEATNQPQQQSPWWSAGNTIAGRGAQPVGRRRSVFYDAQTGAPTSNPGQPIGGDNSMNDLALIREIMQPRSSVVTNDPSGWLNGGASREFQEFFKKTPEKDAAYARRKQELDAGSMANVNPAVSRNAVDVAKKNQEALAMIFPKQPAGDPMASSSDITKQSLPGGGFTAQLDGRYGSGSSTVQPGKFNLPAPATPEVASSNQSPVFTQPGSFGGQAPSPTVNDSFNSNALFDMRIPQYGANVPPMKPNSLTNPFMSSASPDQFQGEYPNEAYMSSLSPTDRVNYENEFYKRKQAKRPPLQALGDVMSLFANPNRGQSDTSGFSFPAL